MLKPGQSLTSYLSDVGDYLDKSFTVTMTWNLQPSQGPKQSLTYWLNMGDYKGVSYLGARDPMTQIADQMKKLREDWQRVAKGQSKLRTDVYTSADRDREQKMLEEHWQRQEEKRANVRKEPGG